MVTVTLPKTKYEQLRRQAEAYRKLAAELFELVLQDPIEEVVRDFRATNLYTEEFLQDLEAGLRKSSYARRYGSKTSKKRLERVS